MERIYSKILDWHLKKYRQMIFLAGPRQVGKTTCSKRLKSQYPDFYYLNWESSNHRKLVVNGPEAIANYLGLHSLKKSKPIVVFDEIHKYRKWKHFLKGFFDLYEDVCQIVVTGSAKLDVYRKGGDSLMGRYFPYHLHPLSVGELINPKPREQEIAKPKKISNKKIDTLLNFGGFPEPYIKGDKRFFNNWQRLRKQQLIQEDVRALSQIQDLAELEILVDLLIEEASTQINVSSLSNQLNIAESTVKRWIKVLETFYFCFTILPWSKNIRRSMRKMPKLYLWDWAMIADQGRKIENFLASHLLKSIQYWTDTGLGEYHLYYLRDKEKREVDFLVTKNKKPWFLVESKTSEHDNLSKSLQYFSKELNVTNAFQVVYEMDYVDKNCFQSKKPIIVPASTFLSQLV